MEAVSTQKGQYNDLGGIREKEVIFSLGLRLGSPTRVSARHQSQNKHRTDFVCLQTINCDTFLSV